jgi:hypothetical protein
VCLSLSLSLCASGLLLLLMLIGFALCAFSPFLSWVWFLPPTFFFLSFWLSVLMVSGLD